MCKGGRLAVPLKIGGTFSAAGWLEEQRGWWVAKSSQAVPGTRSPFDLPLGTCYQSDLLSRLPAAYADGIVAMMPGHPLQTAILLSPCKLAMTAPEQQQSHCFLDLYCPLSGNASPRFSNCK